MEEYRREQEAKKKEVELKKNAVIERIASLEDEMAMQDKAIGRAHPRSRKGKVLMYFCFYCSLRYRIWNRYAYGRGRPCCQQYKWLRSTATQEEASGQTGS